MAASVDVLIALVDRSSSICGGVVDRRTKVREREAGASRPPAPAGRRARPREPVCHTVSPFARAYPPGRRVRAKAGASKSRGTIADE